MKAAITLALLTGMALPALAEEVRTVAAVALPNPDGEDIRSAERTEPLPTYKYGAKVTEDGRVRVRLQAGAGLRAQGRDVLTVYAPTVRKTERLLHSQDWYMVVGPNGAMRGIYTVPNRSSLPSTVLRNLGEGFGVLKVDPRQSFFKIFPTAHELEGQLESFAMGTRDAVCANERRPQTVTASVRVTPGWAAAGKIEFSATWATEDLCKFKALEAKAAAKD